MLRLFPSGRASHTARHQEGSPAECKGPGWGCALNQEEKQSSGLLTLVSWDRASELEFLRISPVCPVLDFLRNVPMESVGSGTEPRWLPYLVVQEQWLSLTAVLARGRGSVRRFSQHNLS